MKKLILVFAAIAIAAGAYAQIDSTSRKMSHMDMNQDQNEHYNPADILLPDGVLMQNGIMMKVEDGEMTILDDEMTMNNGTKIMSDGNYIKEDGTEMMLEEGQHIDMEGNMTTMDIYKDKNMDKMGNMGNMDNMEQNKSDDKSHPDGVMMQNGKMMKVENGRMTILEDDMVMSNGTKVICDGNYIEKDGTKKMMEEGEHIDMAGNKTAMKTK